MTMTVAVPMARLQIARRGVVLLGAHVGSMQPEQARSEACMAAQAAVIHSIATIRRAVTMSWNLVDVRKRRRAVLSRGEVPPKAN